jgi:hypothetical protein
MKRPYFPEPEKPRGDSPYRREAAAPKPREGEREAVVVSRPEPPREELEDKPASPVLLSKAAPARAAKAEPSATDVNRMRARALLVGDAAQNTKKLRARIFIVPFALTAINYRNLFPGFQLLAFAALALSVWVVVVEVRRVWRRTEL